MRADDADEEPGVPPGPPDDPVAWFVTDVRAQYDVDSGVVVTTRDATDGY